MLQALVTNICSVSIRICRLSMHNTQAYIPGPCKVSGSHTRMRSKLNYTYQVMRSHAMMDPVCSKLIMPTEPISDFTSKSALVLIRACKNYFMPWTFDFTSPARPGPQSKHGSYEPSPRNVFHGTFMSCWGSYGTIYLPRGELPPILPPTC